MKQNSSITSITASLNDLTGQGLNVTTPSGANIVSLVSSGMTLANKGALFTSSKIESGSVSTGFYKRTRYNSKFSVAGLPISQFSYLAGIAGSEFSENLMWFSSSVVGLVSTGSWDCGSVYSLIQNYNLSDSQQLILSSFYDTPANHNNGSGDTNSTVRATQDLMLLSLSRNCQTNKASTAVNVLNMFVYMFTSGITVRSMVVFLRSFREAEGIVELEYDDPFLMPRIKGVDLKEAV
ncbi:hypothetical protein PSN45_004198 [Yamadazyma tenuis]|uniref:uncharacterized protein n=1 Tax=Candida tenuis TaxID=2315449 RepID=UPI0027A1CB95|nr:hypothetical protein PSN45_004198 [Yamadazyma tenuis]